VKFQVMQGSRATAPRAGFLLAIAFALLVPTREALAYIPSAASLIRRTGARVSEGGRSRDVTLTGTLWLNNQPRPATLRLRFPLTCTLDGGGGQTATASRSQDGSAVQVTNNGLGAEAADLLRFACPLIAYRGQTPPEAVASLRGFLSAVGVAPTLAPTALARLYDRVTIVLGAQARQLDRPQLWIYKDNAAPARLLAVSNGSLDDLRLLQYGNPASGDWLPRVLELWRGANLRARFEALDSKGLNDAADEEETAPADSGE
jgi:hypothetical protein